MSISSHLADLHRRLGLPGKRARRRFIRRLLSLLQAAKVELWVALPKTPATIPTERSGRVEANGISIFYAIYGKGPPVILLHGGLANADYWGNQIPALASVHTVIIMDSRGNGRSTRDSQPLSYDLMADDVVALMNALEVQKADIVGWSDGAVVGLDLAMRHADRVGKIFAFAVIARASGTRYSAILNPSIMAFIGRARREYNRYSDTPNEHSAFVMQTIKMWTTQPNWTDDDLKTIAAPVLVVNGQHDETIKQAHAAYVAATIPGAQLLILPSVGHFGFLQDPALFNHAVLRFLGGYQSLDAA
jgi:pimeloyl-ACP methyl ester carboxylesterase